jgi:hypothetical protein
LESQAQPCQPQGTDSVVSSTADKDQFATVKSLPVAVRWVHDEAQGSPGSSPDGDFALYRAMVEGERVFAGGQNYLSPLCFDGQNEFASVSLLCTCEVCSEATGQKRKAEAVLTHLPVSQDSGTL